MATLATILCFLAVFVQIANSAVQGNITKPDLLVTATANGINLTATTESISTENNTFFLSFACSDGSGLIDRIDFCNGVSNCQDGSDEILYDPAIHESLPGKRCGKIAKGVKTFCYIPEEYVCDYERDCFFGNDESNCSHTFQCVTNKPFNMYRFRVQFCDGVKDCLDGSDEWKYRPDVPGFQCAVTKTRLTSHCMLPEIHVCDGTADCDDATDECLCDSSSESVILNENCFRCLDDTLVVPRRQLCDMTFHCKDLSDECLCTNGRPSICDQVCEGDRCGACSAGEVRCSSGDAVGAVCINRTQVCDRIYDCPNHEDEQNCPHDFEEKFVCADGTQYFPKHVMFDNYTDCNDGSDEFSENNWYKCSYSIKDPQRPGAYLFTGPAYAEPCDQIPDCVDMDDECNNALCGNITFPSFCKFDHPKYGFKCPISDTSLLGKDVCDGYPTCKNDQPHLSADEMDCPRRLYCADHGRFGLPIHVPQTARCNQISDCNDGSDELGCSTKTHFYCSVAPPTYISRHQVCDGVQNCRGGEDECQNCSKSPFSSDQFLIRSTFLQALVWTTGIFAFFGNFTVLIHNGMRLWKVRKMRTGVAFINRSLVLNLNIADLLLGVYLICLGSVSGFSNGMYCQHDISWRSSKYCSALGCLAVISVQTSVFILAIMTTCRLFAMTRPFDVVGRKRRFGMLIAIAWISSIAIAVIPLLPVVDDSFISAIWYSNNPYLTNPTRSQVEQFVLRLQTFDRPGSNRFFLPNGVRSSTWNSLTETVAKLNPAFMPEFYFGHYSAHGVCLPRIFPDPKSDRTWGYSMFIVTLNFFAFFYMVIAYCIIYRNSKKGSKVSGTRGRSNLSTLQVKIARIVFTNFCCWIPICIMAFMSVGGVAMSDDTYAAAAIILLPINSALNPFLYSKLPDTAMRRARSTLRNSMSQSTVNSNTGTRRTIVSSVTYNKPNFDTPV